jgi:hypothetical protein
MCAVKADESIAVDHLGFILGLHFRRDLSFWSI